MDLADAWVLTVLGLVCGWSSAMALVVVGSFLALELPDWFRKEA